MAIDEVAQPVNNPAITAGAEPLWWYVESILDDKIKGVALGCFAQIIDFFCTHLWQGYNDRYEYLKQQKIQLADQTNNQVTTTDNNGQRNISGSNNLPEQTNNQVTTTDNNGQRNIWDTFGLDCEDEIVELTKDDFSFDNGGGIFRLNKNKNPMVFEKTENQDLPISVAENLQNGNKLEAFIMPTLFEGRCGVFTFDIPLDHNYTNPMSDNWKNSRIDLIVNEKRIVAPVYENALCYFNMQGCKNITLETMIERLQNAKVYINFVSLKIEIPMSKHELVGLSYVEDVLLNNQVNNTNNIGQSNIPELNGNNKSLPDQTNNQVNNVQNQNTIDPATIVQPINSSSADNNSFVFHLAFTDPEHPCLVEKQEMINIDNMQISDELKYELNENQTAFQIYCEDSPDQIDLDILLNEKALVFVKHGAESEKFIFEWRQCPAFSTLPLETMKQKLMNEATINLKSKMLEISFSTPLDFSLNNGGSVFNVIIQGKNVILKKAEKQELTKFKNEKLKSEQMMALSSHDKLTLSAPYYHDTLDVIVNENLIIIEGHAENEYYEFRQYFQWNKSNENNTLETMIEKLQNAKIFFLHTTLKIELTGVI